MKALKDASGQRILPSKPVTDLLGHEGPVNALCFTASGQYALTGGYDRTVRLWNPARIDPANKSASSALPAALPVQKYSNGYVHPISSLCVNRESTILASASDKVLVVTDLLTAKVMRRFTGHHTGVINSVTMTDGGEIYLSASYDGTVKLWDGRSRSSEPLQTWKEAKDSVTSVHVMQPERGEAFVRTSSVDGVLRTYDLRKGQVQYDDLGSPIVSIALTHDKKCIVASCLDGVIRLIDCDSGELLNTYEGNHITKQYAVQCSVSPDDSLVATGSEDGRVVVYDMVTGNERQQLLGPTKPTCLAEFHPIRSGVLLSASYDGTVVVWANQDDSTFIQDE